MSVATGAKEEKLKGDRALYYCRWLIKGEPCNRALTEDSVYWIQWYGKTIPVDEDHHKLWQALQQELQVVWRFQLSEPASL